MNEQPIFLAALEIADPAERAAFVNRACAGDAALRRQVEGLLAAHERTGEFLDEPALQQMGFRAAADRQSPNETAAEPHDGKAEADLSFLQPSTRPDSLGRLGHYEVQEVIGRGGCGVVLKAFDEVLHRTVAIKVMALELVASSPARKRFLREARASAAIRHENVVSIHAVEETPIPFLVMDYIAGPTLQQKLDGDGPLDVQEVVHIGTQIANGLEAAHAIGLIHRDIKPCNILMEQGRDRIKITDFGLARAADDASITQSGVIAGTPLYMSPEQAQGAVIDQRSDLFSLGSVLYVMSSGRPPFRASSALAVLRRVAEDEPRPIREIIPEIPDWLTAIIGKLLAKKPADRFATAREVGVLLTRCLSEMQQRGRVEWPGDASPAIPKPADAVREPVPSASPKSSESPAPAPDKRLPFPRGRRWAAAAAVLMLLLTGFGLTEATGVTDVGGTVIRLFSPDGVLVVEVDDPGVSVSIDGEDMIITGTGATEIRLKPGNYKVLASKDGKVVSQELVTVTKNGRQVVRVSRQPALASGDAQPVAEAVGPSQPSAPATDPDRRAAEWTLSIGGTIKIKEKGEERQIGALRDLPREAFELTGVVLSENKNLSDGGLAHFEGCKNLTVLDLSRASEVSDVGLAHFKDCKGLTHLYLHGRAVSDAGLAHFKDCKNLTGLSLQHTKVSDAGLAHFEDCKNLTHLDLIATLVSDAGLAHFEDFENLTYLNLTGTQVSDAGLVHFKACKRLHFLALQNIKVSDAGLAHFNSCKSLTTLYLGGPQVSDAGLVHFQDCNNLTDLSLNGTNVSDAGLVHFQDCKSLTSVDLSQTNLSDAGLIHFKDLKNLRSVELGYTNVSNAGLAYLKNLTFAGLGRTQVSDVGLAHLQDCKNLYHLNLSQTQVSDAGMASLASLPTLTVLDLTSTRISLRGRDKITAALPNCKITWSETNRTVAERVLALGGSIAIGIPGQPESKPIEAAADLPGDYFQVRRVSLAGLAIPQDDAMLVGLRLLRFPKFDGLESIDLSGVSGLNDKNFLAPIHGLQELNLAKTGVNLHQLPKLPALKRLVLDGNAIDGPMLVPLENFPALTALSVADASLTDDTLAQLPKLSALERLVLDGNYLRGTGLSSLNAQPALVDLSLGCPTLANLNAKNLADLKQLKRLSLAGSGLTDAGITHLAGLTNLQSLDLRRTKATESGVKKLATVLPQCKIEWDGGDGKTGRVQGRVQQQQ